MSDAVVPLASVKDGLTRHAHTLFLFTKSDFKTTVFPITLFALAASPSVRLSNLLQSLLWTWLHLLQFNVANQLFSISEDLLNKADRPLPSNRISISSATRLRWVLVPLCWLQSYCYSHQLMCISMMLSLSFCVYNEGGHHAGHWFVRNLLNAWGLALFEMGATLVASNDPSRLHSTAILATAISGSVYLTTFHAQDFKDVNGVRTIGRCTLPIVRPELARLTMLVGMTLWSICLPMIWQLDLITTLMFSLLGVFVGYRFMARTKVPDDQISFYWYNVSNRTALFRVLRSY
ncbi:hypothetical protein K474DRAFT_1717481 [Panus rudis PR-1116 ss-1]|nr:hypothetical protein K474DRAFT_1717481 [Panus rudis PR-1116 ss-1]